MMIARYFATFPLLVLAFFVLPASAADRMHAGQWVGTTTAGGKSYPASSCISQSDADAMNGDARSIKVYLEKVIPPEICKLTDIKANGSQVIYTATCGAAAPRVVTTSYHGESSEGSDSAGTKSESKRTGACK